MTVLLFLKEYYTESVKMICRVCNANKKGQHGYYNNNNSIVRNNIAILFFVIAFILT